jgi:hypothetical protein
MSRRALLATVVLAAAVVVAGFHVFMPGRADVGAQPPVTAGAEARAEGRSSTPGSGQQAIDRAAQAGHYLFIYFYDGRSPETLSRQEVLSAGARQLGREVELAVVDITDPDDVSFARKQRVARAPMPMVLAFAPTGAVTGAFSDDLTPETLRTAFVSPAMESSLARLQLNHLVLICVQSASTRWNEEAMEGASDFVADERFAGNADVVMLDPSNPAEREFLATLGVDPATPDAVTILMVPPGTAVAQVVGKSDKTTLIKELEASATRPGCAQGAGSGCCPKK